MISSLVTPLFSARPKWPTCCSVRLSAIRAAQVIRLRSRLERPGRSQTSPNSTLSVRSTNLGAKALSASRAADDCTGGLDIIPPWLRVTRSLDPLPALGTRRESVGADRFEVELHLVGRRAVAAFA